MWELNQFTTIVLQLNGEISDRKKYSVASLLKIPPVPGVVNEFRLLLKQLDPPNPENCAKCSIPLGNDGRFKLEFRQPDPFSALGLFLLERRPVSQFLLLSGFSPIHDNSAVAAGQEWLEGPWKHVIIQTGPGLASVLERPLLAYTPYQVPISDLDLRVLGNWVTCLALAFFEFAEGASATFSESIWDHNKPSTN